MKHPAEPAAAFLRRGRRFLGGQTSRQRQRRDGKSKGAAHERLIRPESFRGCGNCQTLYQSAMKATALFVSIVLGVAAISEAKTASTFRVHVEASANNGPTFATKLPLFGRQVTIEKVPTLSENDVTGLRIYAAPDGTRGALFQLNEHGRLALDSLSIERRGGSLFVFINGRPVTEFQIDRRVSDGKIYIASGLTAKDVELLRKDWPRK